MSLVLVLRVDLGALDQSPLGVLAAVDEVGVVEGHLNSTVDNVVGGLDTKHERVVLVADLVAPAAEAAAGVDALLQEAGEELGEDTLTLEGGGWVAVVEAAVVGGDDLVFWPDHLGVDETLDGVGEEGVVVDGLVGRFGDFQHDGPVWTFLGFGAAGLGAVGNLLGGELDGGLRLVVGRVVGEDGGAVEWAIVLGEVELFRAHVSRDYFRLKITKIAGFDRMQHTQHLSPILSGRSPRIPTPTTWVEE